MNGKIINYTNLMDDIRKSIFHKALFIRAFEQHILKGFDLGLLRGTTHTCIGQEVLPAVVGLMAPKNSFFVSNHRNHGHYLSINDSALELLHEIMGNLNGISKGRGGSQHIHSLNFISHGILGGLSPYAVGRGTARRMLDTNTGPVILYLGDGTFGEGVLYEALNLSVVFNSKILILVENNGVSQSTLTNEMLSSDLFDLCRIFIPNSIRSSDKNLDQLLKSVKYSLDYVVEKNKPTVLFVDTERLGPHSKGTVKLDPWYGNHDPLFMMSESKSRELFYELSLNVYESVRNMFNTEFESDLFLKEF